LEETPISLPVKDQLYLYRIDYYHPQIGNDFALAPGTNEKEAYEHFKSTRDAHFCPLGVALCID